MNTKMDHTCLCLKWTSVKIEMERIMSFSHCTNFPVQAVEFIECAPPPDPKYQLRRTSSAPL